MDFLMRYPFPGNVRELENIIEHAFVLCRNSIIEMKHLPQEENSPLDAAEKIAIEKTLRTHSGVRAAAARYLGISTVTLWRKMKKWGIKA